MPKITRKQQKIFASDATNNGVFGSLQANDPVHSQDPDAIQGRTAYANGWDDATYSAEKLPPIEEFQALQYLFSRQIAYIMQEGVPEWDTSTTYYKGALVKALQSDGSFILYASLVDNNQGNLVTDTTKWVITNTSTNFHQGIPNWRADVIYSAGDWVKAQNGGNWSIFESLQNNNLNNDITDEDYWAIKPFTSSLVLLTPQWFDYEIEDISWLRADTFSWQDGTVYTEAYDHLLDDYTNGTSQSETIGTYTITYKLASDGHKITTDETNVANIYNESGVAWYYILDTTNQRFKLPRTKYGFVGLRDTVGKYVPESLPNLIGQTNGAFNTDGSPSGVFSFVGTGSVTFGSGSTTYKNRSIRYNASDYSSTYQDNAPVQQRATQMYLYFYVGNFTQTATEQTAGLNSELFNGKLDIDLGNLPSVGKSYLAGLGMPSDTYEDLTYTASSFYTAPANGYVVIDKIVGTGSYLFCASYPHDYTGALGNVSAALQAFSRYKATGNNDALSGIISVKKGDKFEFEGNANGTTRLCRFVYAEGEV